MRSNRLFFLQKRETSFSKQSQVQKIEDQNNQYIYIIFVKVIRFLFVRDCSMPFLLLQKQKGNKRGAPFKQSSLRILGRLVNSEISESLLS